MKKTTRFTVYAAAIAALYLILTHLQNLIIPDSASFAIQCRLSEALCVLAFFTPAAIPGLTLGCLLFNLTFSGTLPLDFLLGSLATLLAALSMWFTRNVKWKGIPLPGLAMPAITNAILVGWELAIYIGGGFWFNAACVAIGELIVLYIPGILLYRLIISRGLDRKFFS